MRSFIALRQVALGLRTDHVLSARLPLPRDRYKSGDQLNSFFRPLLTRLKSVPGVVYATESSALPPFGGIRGDVEVSGKSHQEKWYSFLQLCSEDYFSVLRIPILEGRIFTEDEVNDKRQVAVINQTFQRRYFGKDNPIGQKIQFNRERDFPDGIKDKWFEVIGIVADARNRGLQEPIDPETWVPYTVTGSEMRGILVRTTNNPATMVKAVAKEIWATDPSVAMAEPFPLDQTLDVFTFAQPRFGLWIVGIFAGIGLALVTIGVYSVVAYSTARRTHEIRWCLDRDCALSPPALPLDWLPASDFHGSSPANFGACLLTIRSRWPQWSYC